MATRNQGGTISQLVVNFDILEPWRNDPNYVVNYNIEIANQAPGGGSRTITTPSVDSSDFLVIKKYKLLQENDVQ